MTRDEANLAIRQIDQVRVDLAKLETALSDLTAWCLRQIKEAAK